MNKEKPIKRFGTLPDGAKFYLGRLVCVKCGPAWARDVENGSFVSMLSTETVEVAE